MMAMLLILAVFLFDSVDAMSFVHCSWRKTCNSALRAARPTKRRPYSSYRTPIVMMPEGPEVRVLVDNLQAAIGRRLVDIQFQSGRYADRIGGDPPEGLAAFRSTMTHVPPSDDANAAEDLSAVDVILDWKCKGKFQYIILDDGSSLAAANQTDFQRSIWITLGMTGRLVNEAEHKRNNRHSRWYLELLNVQEQPTNGAMKRIYYQDQRNFGTIKFCLSREALNNKLESLGPDILLPTTTEDDFFNILRSSRKPSMNICRFLMNQGKLSGIGNYILAEGLYRARIDPFASLQELDESQQGTLFKELKAVALESYEAQGMTRPKGGQFRNADGQTGNYAFELQCYGRKVCAKGNPVRRGDGPHGRTIWYTDDQLFMSRNDRQKLTQTTDTQNLYFPTPQKNHLTPTPADDEIADLASGLTDKSWKEALSETLQSESFRKLTSFLQTEAERGAKIYPQKKDIFAAFNLCPLEKVKVVIVGQDPYHGPGQAHGLAFSVSRSCSIPPSLRNILNEVNNDVGSPPPIHGNLEHWAKQGVLLLNTVLTVRNGEANSHKGKGWEEFTDSVIKHLNDSAEDSGDGLVFLLWGAPAAKKAVSVNEKRHTVIRSSHPSPLAATRTASPFIGSRCFSRANSALRNMGKEAIDWSVI